ncbi:hypothetical protein CPC08DRAFT_394285 [Agrocybe pediades]|nr:hypothetical protein CPC08DRAFT_394285 [Agrocybe pediades]
MKYPVRHSSLWEVGSVQACHCCPALPRPTSAFRECKPWQDVRGIQVCKTQEREIKVAKLESLKLKANQMMNSTNSLRWAIDAGRHIGG